MFPLCDLCQKLRDHICRVGSNMEYSTNALREVASGGNCHSCDLLWGAVKNYGNKENGTVSFNRTESVLMMNSRTPVLSIVRDYDLAVASLQDVQIGFPKLPASASPAHFEVIRAWIEECEKDGEHHECRLTKGGFRDGEISGKMPTRVIDVGCEPYPEAKICLHITDPEEEGSWIALSHPWGNETPYQTTRSNYDEFRAGIDLEQLPATFRDAVVVTRALGQRYLWIDSLCIIQGPDGDFNEQAPRMEAVYSGAHCVIAASCATGHHSGFLQLRDDRDFVTLGGDSKGSFYLCTLIDDFQKHVLDGPLNKRAWVMQEHALARRTIFFTGYQTYWECGQGVRCETLASMKNNLAASLGDPSFPRVLSDAARGERIFRYQQIYRDYSRLSLTKEYDRPMAVDGIQRRLLRAMDAKGKFGMFDGDKGKGLLCRSLLWCRGDPGTSMRRINFPSNREINSVPSWSWMAYTGEIDYLQPEFGQYSWSSIIPPWSDEDAYPLKVMQDGTSILIAEARKFINHKHEFGQKLIFDVVGEPNVKELWCVILGTEKRVSIGEEKRHFVLLVERPENVRRNDGITFQRVGVGCLKANSFASESCQIFIC